MDRLNPTVLISRLPSLLPEANKKLDCDEAGLAALLHTAMAELDFILIALDEHDSPTTGLNNVLPKDWAQNGPSQYTFCYKHKLQSDSKYLLKVIKLGDQTSCKAIDVEVRRVAFSTFARRFSDHSGTEPRVRTPLSQYFYLPS